MEALEGNYFVLNVHAMHTALLSHHVCRNPLVQGALGVGEADDMSGRNIHWYNCREGWCHAVQVGLALHGEVWELCCGPVLEVAS